MTGSCVMILAALTMFGGKNHKGIDLKPQIDVLKARIGSLAGMPDPTNIELASQWYLLDHISSGLVTFDHVEGKFKPGLAEWNSHRQSGVHTFTLKPDARFSDGTPITAQDIVVSLKRLLIRKTSTHFPLWEYIEGADSLKNMSDNCTGLFAVNDKTVEIRLKNLSESFFLQLASPETGIWSAKDLNAVHIEEFKPTKFSGPYAVAKIDGKTIDLKRNEYNFISEKFPNSPKEILLSTASAEVDEKRVNNKDLDLLIRSHKPFTETNWQDHGMSVYASAPSTLIFFYGTDLQGQTKVGQDFLKTLWATSSDKELIPADKFLPFAGSYSLSKNQFMETLPSQSARKVRIAVPWNHLSDEFLSLLKNTGARVGMDVELTRLERQDWLKSFDDPKAKDKFDFIIGIYAASERYPAVQLRYITGGIKSPDIDLKLAESPDLTSEKVKILKNYQEWLLQKQHAVPLFFVRSLIIHQPNIDLGDQPPSDAEVELWRLTRK